MSIIFFMWDYFLFISNLIFVDRLVMCDDIAIMVLLLMIFFIILWYGSLSFIIFIWFYSLSLVKSYTWKPKYNRFIIFIFIMAHNYSNNLFSIYNEFSSNLKFSSTLYINLYFSYSSTPYYYPYYLSKKLPKS